MDNTGETTRPKSALQVDGLKEEESCRSCLYTGVSTCVGLSGYFLYLAMEEEAHRTTKQLHNSGRSEASPHVISPSNSSKRNILTAFQSSIVNFSRGDQIPTKNRPFLFAMSAVWCVAGAYRLYLNWCLMPSWLRVTLPIFLDDLSLHEHKHRWPLQRGS